MICDLGNKGDAEVLTASMSIAAALVIAPHIAAAAGAGAPSGGGETTTPGGEITPFPAGFDHLRSIPVRLQEAKTSGEAPQRETASS